MGFPRRCVGRIPGATGTRPRGSGDSFDSSPSDNDEPSVRASTVRLMASISTIGKTQDLAEEFLAAECRRSGPPRFALDILTNRIRPAMELMREVLRTSNG